MTAFPQKSGFSLVELSIVLVILGLLTGGILGGRELIKAAELRAVSTEYDKWQTSVYTFRTKYLGLPGDLRNAQSFWGIAASCPPSPGTDVVGTCNGDGDGIIGNHQEAGEIYEQFMFWQHLENAGLVSGDFSGSVGAGGSYEAVIGENVPASKFSNAGWTARFRNNVPAGEPFWFAGDYGNAYVFGAQTGTITHGAVLTPAEAWNIDLKSDDGKPGKGKVMARHWNTCTLADDNEDFEAEYDLSKETAECSLNFRSVQ